MGERENILAIEVTPESSALAQGEKKVMMEKEKERGKFVKLHARWDMPEVSYAPAMFLVLQTIRCKNALKLS